MNVCLCTLFEGDYHLGAAALLNSLHRAGFDGLFICGHRGPKPDWAGRTDSLHPITVRWVAINPSVHLTNYKPDFLLACLDRHAPDADVVAYLDPDIVLKARWPFFERWILGGGIALCEDVNPNLPAGHPYRLAWREFFARYQLTPLRNLERYYNAGFLAVPRPARGFLECWSSLIRLAEIEIGTLGSLKHGSPDALFHTPDQDALNMALMLQDVPVHAAGPDGMDFQPGGVLLSHAIGQPKPWRGGFLRTALSGYPPGPAHKLFYQHAPGPLAVWSPARLALRRLDLRAAALVGRFYHRS